MSVGSQKGSALLIILALSAVIAIVLPVGYTLVRQAQRRATRRSSVQEYTNLVMSLKSELNDPYGCSPILSGLTVPVGTGKVASVKLNWRYADSPDPLAAGWRSVDHALQVQDVQMERTGDIFDHVRLVVDGVNYNYDSVPIRIYVIPKGVDVNLADDSNAAPETPERVPPMFKRSLMIQLHADMDASRRIFSCFGADSPAAACEAIGGAFYWMGPSDLRCQPDQICFMSFAGLVLDPGQCQPPGHYPYKARAVGKINGRTEYICSLCHDDLLN